MQPHYWPTRTSTRSAMSITPASQAEHWGLAPVPFLLAGAATGILSTDTYDMGLLMNFVPYNVFFALVKAYTFAFIISTIPSYYGYYVKGGALEIGRSSTKSVVVSCVMILFADYILAALLLDK